MRILIVGLGSIGLRHLNNLISLGYEDIIIATNRNYKNKEKKNIKVFKNIDQALKLKPNIAFVCNVTSKHISTAIKCAKNNCNLFIEKPLSHNLRNINLLLKILKKKKLYCYVGYMMRFHPHIKKIKKIIDNKKFGKLMYFKSHWGELVSDWHPNENYKKSYSTNVNMGGGPTLTLSHDIDLCFHLISSKINKAHHLTSKISNLKINSSDTADILIEFSNSSIANIHINYFEKPYKRNIYLIFQKGNIFFDYYKNLLKISQGNHYRLFKLKGFSRNDMFLNEIKFFFKNLKTKKYKNSNFTNSINIIKISKKNKI